MRPGSDRGVSRRDFVAAAVAIGGSSALSACLDREGESVGGGDRSLSAPSGTDPSNLPESQHVWNQYLVHGPHGNTMLPNHQLVLGLTYTGSVPPTEEERAAVAYEEGYFDVPRGATTEDVAAELDLDSSTVSEHLTRAQHNLLSGMLSASA